MAYIKEDVFEYMRRMARRNRRFCVACGDRTGRPSARLHHLEFRNREPHEDEMLYCEECADEKFRGRLSTEPARLFSPGAGSPLEPSDDDAGPWGENAIRSLEDG
jgi:hypothetical protein